MTSNDDEGQSSTVVDGYLKLWEGDTTPDLDAYIMNSPAFDPTVLSEVIRIDMRQRWERGERNRAEQYLEKYPSLYEDPEAVIDLVYSEFLLLELTGTKVDAESFICRFPKFADQLRAQIELHRLTESLDGIDTIQNAYTSSRRESLDKSDGHHAESSTIIADRFRLLRCLGEGGMGVVWEAEELASGRHVALKMLKGTLRWNESSIARLLKEGQLAGSISHPRCAYVFEVSFHRSQPFLVMEYLPGNTLRELAHDDQLTHAKAVDYILDVLEGIEAAHEVGLYHRDIKPSNCFIDSIGRVKVGDFGLARLLDEDLERLGQFQGTPAFAAPEQILGAGITEKTDQYGIAATLYYLLTAQLPFQGRLNVVKEKVLYQPPIPVSTLKPSIPPELARIVARGLSKDPGKRFSSLNAMRQSLLPFSHKQTTLANVGNVGKRMIAFALDQMIIFLLVHLIVMLPNIMILLTVHSTHLREMSVDEFSQVLPGFQSTATMAFVIVQYAYFVGLEGFWGAGLGKRWLGLRVVAHDAGTPGLLRASLRALILPSSFGLVFLDPFVAFGSSTPSTLQPNVREVYFQPLLYAQIHNVLLLICVSSIRPSNGLRGLHELFSQTRTVCLPRRTTSKIEPVRWPSFHPVGEACVWGPYQPVRKIAERNQILLWEAFDSVLKRPAWIVERKGSPHVYSHFHSDRTTRPRWLQGGEINDVRWDAYEVIPGVPFCLTALTTFYHSWDVACIMLCKLVSELLESEREGTTPRDLSASQIIVQPSGHLTLVDFPVDPADHAASDFPVFSSDRRAVEFVWWMTSLVGERKVWPPQYSQFVDALAHSMASNSISGDVLAEAKEHLSQNAERTTMLQWNDRFCLLCSTLFVETIGFSLLIGTSGFLVSQFCPNAWWAFCLHLTLSLSLPMIQPLLFQRSLVANLLGIIVARVDGVAAGRLRVAIRDFLAWLPYTLSTALVAWTVGLMLKSGGHLETDSSTVTLLLLSTGLIVLLSLTFFLINFILVFVTPGRSIQDRIAATCLFMR